MYELVEFLPLLKSGNGEIRVLCGDGKVRTIPIFFKEDTFRWAAESIELFMISGVIVRLAPQNAFNISQVYDFIYWVEMAYQDYLAKNQKYYLNT